MTFGLPVSVDINGKSYAIRTDFRVIIEIMMALNDPELDGKSKAYVAISIFYPDWEDIPSDDMQEALEKCFWFIDAGQERDNEKHPKLMDWEQDYFILIPPINRVLGTEVRAIPYDPETNTGGLHWWTFLGAYYEIGGECTYAQVVSIRNKLARNKKLEKYEKEWLRDNRKLVDFKMKYTEADDNLLKQWI